MTFPRILNRNRLVLGLATLAFATAIPLSQPADAVPNYDGLWSVVIVTKQGICDPSYRAALRIKNGNMANAGNATFTISGKVDRRGMVVATISSGPNSATGTGRLNGKTGGGSWSGGPCAGTWHAEKRA
jgi:hypothetical protein